MKAVLQAGWLFTVAVGNFIVLIVAELAKLPKQVQYTDNSLTSKVILKFNLPERHGGKGQPAE